MTDTIEELKKADPTQQSKIIAHLYRRDFEKKVKRGLSPDVVLNAMLAAAVELSRAGEGDQATLAVLHGIIAEIERSDLSHGGTLQ